MMQNYNRRMLLNGMAATAITIALPAARVKAAEPLLTDIAMYKAYEMWRDKQREIMFALACCCYRNDEFVERDRAILMQMLNRHDVQKGQVLTSS